MGKKIMKNGGGKTKTVKSKHEIGFIDRLLENMPEIHIRGYNYCGPNTDLAPRLAHGEPGINKLDCACMEHDIAYTESCDLNTRCVADKLLIMKAIKCVYARDSQIGERFAAMLVSGLIGVKLMLGKTELYINKVRRCLTMKKKKIEKKNI